MNFIILIIAPITLAMNHEKVLKSLMKNVTKRLTALEQDTNTPGKTTILQLKHAQTFKADQVHKLS